MKQLSLDSKLNWNLRDEGQHRALRDFYRELLRLRREVPALAQLDMETLDVEAMPGTLFLRRWNGSSLIFAIFHFDSILAKSSRRCPAAFGAN